MAAGEIDKLKEKVEKDPNSKLFVPLAEEYRKEGMLDEAITVLLKGIERQPSYMSARVSLGKMYMEKGMPTEARAEFESVIKSIPDNLYAHKKLAEIYRDSGDRETAVREYRTILKLNSMDEDALENLRRIEAAGSQASGQAVTPEAVPHKDLEFEAVPEAADELPDSDETEHVKFSAAGAIDESAGSSAELDMFKDALFGGKSAGDAGSDAGSEEGLFEASGLPEGGLQELNEKVAAEAITELPEAEELELVEELPEVEGLPEIEELNDAYIAEAEPETAEAQAIEEIPFDDADFLADFETAAVSAETGLNQTAALSGPAAMQPEKFPEDAEFAEDEAFEVVEDLPEVEELNEAYVVEAEPEISEAQTSEEIPFDEADFLADFEAEAASAETGLNEAAVLNEMSNVNETNAFGEPAAMQPEEFPEVEEFADAEEFEMGEELPKGEELNEAFIAEAEPAIIKTETAGGARSMEDADRLVSQGNYAGAMRMYHRVLSSSPGNNMVLQRIEELRSLLKMLGKDKDALIESLGSFQQGIIKRRDEFYGSA